MRMIAGYGPMAVAMSTLLLAGGAVAQDADEEEISGIRLGPALRLQPSLGTEVFFTDNRFRSEDNEESETGLRLDPSLLLSYTPSAGTYKLGYKGSIDPVVGNDYDDHEVFLTGDLRPLTRHHFEFDANYKQEHDDIGVGRTEGVADPDSLELDEWNEAAAHVQYTFGAPDARINVSARAGVTDRESTTNEAGPFGTRFFDHKSVLFGGGATYRLGPKTQLVLDLQHQEFEYDVDAAPTFDSTLDRGLVGIRWVATAKTTGEILVGYFDRNFDADQREDVDGVDWRATVTWGPVTSTQFSLSTGRLILENFQSSDFVNVEYYQLVWRQDWTSRFYSKLKGGLLQSEFEGTTRSDDSTQFGAALFYELSPKVTVKAGVELSTRDSSTNTADYDRNVLFQGFEFVF